jgi:hypothetical protein
MGSLSLPLVNPKLASTLDETLAALKAGLGDNLHSCCLYGSAVRGNAIEGVSDVNLLIVLNDSDPAAHTAVGRALEGRPAVDPFILGKRDFARSARAFATKFSSIRRHHRILHGADPFADFKTDPQLERFLCEQGLRNLRLRMVYSFTTRGRHKNYDRFIVSHVTAIFVQLAEALRLAGISIPTDFAARIPIFEREFKLESQVLHDLLALKRAPRRVAEADMAQWHGRVLPLLDAVLQWVEERWAL